MTLTFTLPEKTEAELIRLAASGQGQIAVAARKELRIRRHRDLALWRAH